MTLMTILVAINFFFIGTIFVNQFATAWSFLSKEYPIEDIASITIRNLCAFTIACITLAIITRFTPY